MNGIDRLAACFETVKKQHRAAFISYTTFGYPDIETSMEIIKTLITSGSDIIEIGLPFSDPMADGPIIQESSRHAIQAGTNVEKTIDGIAKLRAEGFETPIVLMGYFNPIYNLGEAAFVERAASAGVDGLIVVDTPVEEDHRIRIPCQNRSMAFIRLATPTSDTHRLRRIVDETDGYLYYVSVAGITGTKQASSTSLRLAAQRLRTQCHIPIAVGFGIRTPDQVHEASQHFDAVICGSAVIEQIKASQSDGHQLSAFIKKMVAATGKGVVT